MNPRVRSAVAAVVCALLSVACTGGSNNQGVHTSQSSPRDDFGRVISLDTHPHRVISLNPTTTETIFAIGAGSKLIGRSHWDEWPDAAKTIPDMGNGIGINVEQLVAAHPDLVILYASEDNRAAAERLNDAGVATLSLKIDRIVDFDRAIMLLGRILGDSAGAAHVADTVSATLAHVDSATASLPHPTVVWPLVDASPMVVGGGSFMNELIDIAGGKNIYAGLKQPSPVVAMEDVVEKNPQFVIRGGEGGSTTPLGGVWSAVPAVAKRHLIVVPPTFVLRPSVQMGAAATILARALHPGLVLP